MEERIRQAVENDNKLKQANLTHDRPGKNNRTSG
jgi:hypothetical protein